MTNIYTLMSERSSTVDNQKKYLFLFNVTDAITLYYSSQVQHILTNLPVIWL